MLVNFLNNGGNIAEILGISEDRMEELHEDLKSSFLDGLQKARRGENNSLTDILEGALVNCDTIQEICYVSFLCGRKVGEIESVDNEKGN